MTLPDERYRAMKCGYQFLTELCNPTMTPKVPKAVRERARSILKHYPGNYHFEMIAESLPKEFSKTSTFLKLVNTSELNDNEFDPSPRLA